MKALYLIPLVAAAALLSACGQKSDTSTAALQQTVDNGSAMGNMAMPGEAKKAKSIGTVTTIDKAAGKITLDHQAIPQVGWPAMTMTFDAKPAVLGGIAVGDSVAFDVTIRGNAGEVTSVTKR